MPPASLAFDDHGSVPAVVLVHGHPFDRSMWAPQQEPLGRRFRVVTPDLRGFGESPATPGKVTMRELAGDVEALLDELGVDSAAVVGLSMGGLVAMELALASPNRWWALGLVATTAAPLTEAERRERLATAETVETEGLGPLADSMSKRLFGPGAVPAALRLTATKTTSTGVVVNTYQRAGTLRYGAFSVDEQTSTERLFKGEFRPA